MSVFNQIEMANTKTINSYEYAIESITNTLTGKAQTDEMLSEYNDTIKSDRIKKLLEKLQEVVNFERFCGRQKEEAIRVIKAFFQDE